MDFPSRLDLYALGRDYVLQKAAKIDPTMIDVAGSDANLFVGSQSVVGAHVVNQLAFAAAALTLDGAEGDDLDRLAWDRYSEKRKGASAALGAVTFSRPTVAGGAGTVATGTKLTTLTGVEYITTSPASFGAGDLTSSANVRAVQAGKESQVGTHAIAKFTSPGGLFDRSISVDNPLPTAGGEPAEDDDTFRSRLRNFWINARRGILSAIEQGATSVPGVVSAQAVEALTATAQPARVVNLYISDSSGVASQALATAVLTNLNDFRAGGIAVIVSTSIPSLVEVDLRLQFAANVDTVALGSLVQAAVFNFVNSLPVNAPLYLADLYSVLRRFVNDGLVVSQGSIASPVGDLFPAVGQTLRTTLAQVVLLAA